MRNPTKKSDTHPVTPSTERPELEALLGWSPGDVERT
jgi:hypothetical protein